MGEAGGTSRSYTTRHLRHEAEARDRFDLDASQHAALVKIAESLAEAIAHLGAEAIPTSVRGVRLHDRLRPLL